MPTAKATSPINDIFPSPRVVDHDAFVEYSELLRTLVRESAELRATLREETDRARGLSDELAARWGHQGRDRQRVDTINEALRSLDARLSSAQESLDRLDPAQGFEARLNDLTRSFAERTRAAQQEQALAIDALKESLDERLREVEARMSKRLRMVVDETERGVETAAQRLLDLLDRAQTFASEDGGLPQLLEKLERARALASESQGDLEETQDRARSTLAAIQPALNEAQREITQLEARRSATLEAVREAVELCRSTESALRDRLRQAGSPSDG